MILETGAGEMVQLVKRWPLLVTKSDDLSSLSGTRMVEGDN